MVKPDIGIGSKLFGEKVVAISRHGVKLKPSGKTISLREAEKEWTKKKRKS